MNNGGCSHVCTNPLIEGEDVTCSCENTPLVIDPDGSAFQCGKSSLISYISNPQFLFGPKFKKFDLRD